MDHEGQTTALAEEYFDTEIAPSLRRSGTPEFPISRLKKRYLEDVLKNEQAVRDLQEWKHGN